MIPKKSQGKKAMNKLIEVIETKEMDLIRIFRDIELETLKNFIEKLIAKIEEGIPLKAKFSLYIFYFIYKAKIHSNNIEKLMTIQY